MTACRPDDFPPYPSAPAMGALASPRQRSHRSSGLRIPVQVPLPRP
jgi:hypothetical protein